MLAILPAPQGGASRVNFFMMDTQSQIFSLESLRRALTRALWQGTGAILAVSVFGAAVAFAEEAEGAHHGSIADLASNWVNFIIYVALLYVLLRNVIPAAWAARRQNIRETVLASKEELEAAERELHTVEALTQNLPREQARAQREIIEQAELEALAIKAAAVERAERTKAQAKDLLVGEGRSAESQVRASLVAKAIELARKRFASGEYSNRQATYVDAAIDRAKRLVQ